MQDFLVDIHCHIVPYVDDGASVMEEAAELLKSQYDQGVRFICATPHLRSGVFETSDEDILREFGSLQGLAASLFPELSLFVSREYQCDELFKERLRRDDVIPLGTSRVLLIEFSYHAAPEQAHRYIRLVRQAGYDPLIAHVERYMHLRGVEEARRLIDLGARLQVNASGFLGTEGMQRRRAAGKLLKEGLVHLIGSDCHDMSNRPCLLRRAFEKVKRRFGEQTAMDLFQRHALDILLEV